MLLLEICVKREKCVNAKTLELLWSILMWTPVFGVSVSKSVMSINGLSFVSARPAPQPCVSVFMVWGIQEYQTITLNDR